MRAVVWLVVLLALVGAGYYWYQRATPAPPEFRLATVSRGDVRATISASGTLAPEELVDVGAQVAGKIDTLGTDPSDSTRTIDYGSRVEAGTVLAQIDAAVFQTQVDQARANLQRAQAEVEQQRARLYQQERNWTRAQDLAKKSAITDSEFDLARAEFETAKAALAIAEAAVAQAQATLGQAEINLGYTTIKSPVQGVIIDRRVNVGQTVVASLNAPSLFLIAKDLRRMQVWAAVNEADVGQIRVGQGVRFQVDAYPGETFRGEVAQIRLNATMTQNVVTYTVVISTDNADGRLLPYLTANVQFEVAERRDVVRVPNAALRWRPEPELMAGEANEGASAAGGRAAERRAEGAAGGKAAGDGQANEATARNEPAAGGEPGTHDEGAATNEGVVWVTVGRPPRQVRPVPVTLGLSDATLTEVLVGDLEAGAEVVVGVATRTDQAADAANPLVPQMMRRRGG